MAWSDPFLNMLVVRPHDKWHFLEESLTIECLNILLVYNCLTVLYWLLLNTEVNRPSVHTCPRPPGPPFLPTYPIFPGHHGALRYRAAFYCTRVVNTRQSQPPNSPHPLLPLPTVCKPKVNKPKLCGFMVHGSLEDVTSAMQLSGHKMKTFHSL